MTKLIEMPFGWRTHKCPRKPHVRCGSGLPKRNGQHVWRDVLAHCNVPTAGECAAESRDKTAMPDTCYSTALPLLTKSQAKTIKWNHLHC